jgi:hypothetical protein
VIRKTFERICALPMMALIVALMALPAQSATTGTLGFSASSYTVTQNAGFVTFTVNRSGGTSGTASVHYGTSNGTAVAGRDYVAIGGTLKWANGDASPKTFRVYISKTAAYSGTRSFNLTLSYARGATLGTPVKAAVNIKGSVTSASSVSLTSSSYSVAQNGGSITVSVKRAGGSSGTASVNYATANGTAISSTHYTSKSGTLSWTSGDATNKTISIPVLNTSPFTGTKSFTIALSGAIGASMATPAVATITISGSGTTSTAGTIGLSSSTYSVAQTASAVNVTVNRANGTTGAVSVQYATSNGTAVGGKEYTAKSGTLSWAAGDSASKTISVPVSNATPFTGSKSFTIALSQVSGGATLGTSSATVNIAGSASTTSSVAVRVQGNHLVDAKGNLLQLRGVNTAALEFWPIQITAANGSDYWGGQSPNLDAIKAWGANTIRVPLNSNSYLGQTCYNLSDGSARLADPLSKYRAVVKQVVDAATARGMYVILDMHKNAPKGTVTGHTGKVQTCSISATQQQMADADNSVAYWTAVATDFKGYPNVIFDLYNEPYFDSFVNVSTAADKWKALRDGGISRFYYASNQTVNEQYATAGMQAMLNAVRATGATNVVMAAGISWAQDFSQWVTYKPNDPINQLAMSWHAYPYYGAAFGTPEYTQPGLGAVSYDWAQAVLNAGFPIIIGETGDRSVNGTTSAPFLAVLLPWADAHNVSVVGWGWNAWGESSANLIKDASGTPTDGYGVAFKAWMVNHP